MNIIYTYTHKDGRKASTGHGSWQALRDAIGKEDASKLLNEQDRSEHIDLHQITVAKFIVKGEVMGTFTKEMK